jgi:hypothetical protein
VTARAAATYERGGSRLLWVGTLTGPAAWSVQLLINYNIEEFACAPAMRDPGTVWGVGVETIVLSVTIVLALATAAAGVLSFTCWRKNTTSEDTSPGEVSTWMSIVGMMSSVLFLIIIVVGVAPPFFLQTCRVGI